MCEPISIVIRAYNEAPELQRLFDYLKAQTYEGPVEYVVVDNGSHDATAAVARANGAKVVTLPQSEFSYPKSLNLGICATSHELVVCLVAHCFPDNPNWLAAGARHFSDHTVDGLFSFVLPLPNGTLFDGLICWPFYLWSRIWGARRLRRTHPGIFGATNVMLRKSTWREHPFDEAYAYGGEDAAWAIWALKNNRGIIREPAFTVRHSHNIKTLPQFLKQVQVWLRTSKPRPFSKAALTFRNDSMNNTKLSKPETVQR